MSRLQQGVCKYWLRSGITLGGEFILKKIFLVSLQAPPQVKITAPAAGNFGLNQRSYMFEKERLLKDIKNQTFSHKTIKLSQTVDWSRFVFAVLGSVLLAWMGI